MNTGLPSTTVLVPVSDGSEMCPVVLDEGAYMAQVRLPNGSFLTNTLRVLPGANPLAYTIQPRESPSSAPLRPVFAPMRRGAPSKSSTRARQSRLVRPSSPVDADDAITAENSAIALVESSVSPASIRAALKSDSTNHAELVGACIGRPDIKDWTFSGPIEGGGMRASVPLSTTASHPLTQEDSPSIARRYAFVYNQPAQTRTAKLLLCLPGEWRGIGTLRTERMQVDVTRNWDGDKRRLRATLTLTDPRMQSMLGFMQTGDVAAAMEVMDASLEVLDSRSQNPYAAAGAAYLLMNGTTDTNAPWEDWVSYLARKFGDLPDGNILHATLLLQRGRQLAERFRGGSHFPMDEAARLALALDRVQGAITKGVPLYRFGIRYLLTNLSILRRAFPDPSSSSMDLAAAERLVGWLSMRVDSRQPFTVLDVSDV